MRLKSELYEKEQFEIVDKIIDILDLDKDNSIILYELDNDKNKIKQITDLTTEIRKYFTFSHIIGVQNPSKAKRPYLSIIRHITKLKYNMMSCDVRIEQNNKKIRTKKYIFLKKEI
jgi:hypothetical protein